MLFQILKEGMGLRSIVRRTRSAKPRDQKVTLSRRMMAPKLRFSCCLKAKAPGAVTCTALVPAPTSRSSKVLQAQRPSTEHKKQRWWRWGFFFFTFFQVYVYILPTFWRRAPALTFSWQVTRIATMLVYSYRRSLDEDGRSLWVGTPRSSFTASFLTRRPSYQFPRPASLHRHSRRPRFQQDETSSLLDRRCLESIETYSSYQLVSHLGTSTTLFPAISTKTARSIEELFSQWTKPKRASSDQRTDEEDTSETCNNNHVGGRALTNA